jgi:hypothetical protein
MVRHPSSLGLSPRHKDVFQSTEAEVPQILQAAWAVCTPADKPLSEQLNMQEKTFLILLAEYIMTALESPLSATDPGTVLSDILMTARHRLSLLSKEVSLSPGYVVIVTILQLMANLFAADNMKYSSIEGFMEVYPMFHERSNVEKEKLFHTANWMHILFQITTAKKNKGLVMQIIPKFVEGNSAQYVTGSGQTQPTRDRVTIYEKEGNVQPIKRVHRKAKIEGVEIPNPNGGTNKKQTKKKPTVVKREKISPNKPVVVRAKSPQGITSVQLSHSPTVHHVSQEEGVQQEVSVVEDYDPVMSGEDDEERELQSQFQNVTSNTNSEHETTNVSSDSYQKYLPLPLMAPPIPVRRSQSSFSQAAALIASFSQSSTTNAPASYLKSPREFYLDVDTNGTIRKSSSANWGSVSLTSPRAEYQDQLQMLREVSEDSDFSCVSHQVEVDENAYSANSVMSSHMSMSNILPPHLQQQPLSLSIPTSGFGGSLGSPNPQPRSLERCPTSSLDENGEVDFELLEEMSRQAGLLNAHSWLSNMGGGVSLSRSTSASSLTGGGRESTLTVNG